MTDKPASAVARSPLGPTCRHYSQMKMLTDRQPCSIGHPILKIVTAANGKSAFGIGYMLPCRPGPERKAECPDYDTKTPEEIAADQASLRAAMDRFIAALPVLNSLRSTMIEGRIARMIADCPFCTQPRSLHVTCAIGHNNHMSACCTECGQRFIE